MKVYFDFELSDVVDFNNRILALFTNTKIALFKHFKEQKEWIQRRSKTYNSARH